MATRSLVRLKNVPSVCFVALILASGLVSCGGGGGAMANPNGGNSGGATVPDNLPSSISEAAACAAYPPLLGTTYYYCDCGTGAAAGCVPGNDSNTGTDPANPRRTLASAITRLNSLAADQTVALCKGGAFNATAGLTIGASRCAAGSACNDFRDYTPTTFGGTAKPIINSAAGVERLFNFSGNVGGVRLLNLKLNGVDGANNSGFFFYNGAHDVTMCNLEMSNFALAVYNAGGNAGVVMTNNIVLTGSTIMNSRVMGFLGGGDNSRLTYNYWGGNGSTNSLDHAIYFSAHQLISNMTVEGNHIIGQYGATCLGAPIVGHGRFSNLLVKNNVVDIAADAVTGGCWGISFSHGGYTEPVYLRNSKFTGNTVINGGNMAFSVDNCPDCIIENNLIIQNWRYGPTGNWSLIGIKMPSYAARTSPADDAATRMVIRNNTVWFGPLATGGGKGIIVGVEGSGHIVANNTVTYSSSSAGEGVDCYDYTLGPSAYSFINNNHCYSTAAYEWVSGRGSLAAWQSYATTQGWDSNSVTGATNFVDAPNNFKPNTGSPLISAGSNAYGAVVDILGVTRRNPPDIGAFEH